MGQRGQYLCWMISALMVAQVVAPPKNNCVPKDYTSKVTLKSLACIQCLVNTLNNNFDCFRCKNTPTRTDGTCGLPERDKIPIANCNIYFEYNKKCVSCELGYTLYQNQCTRSSIKDCVVSDKVVGSERCYSCNGDNTMPKADGPSFPNKCKQDSAIQSSIERSVEGKGCQIYSVESMVESKDLKYVCSLCKGDFILKLDSSTGKRTCVAPPPPDKPLLKGECGEGCAYCVDEKCQWCNHYNNYFMVDRFKCVKQATLLLQGLLFLLAAYLL